MNVSRCAEYCLFLLVDLMIALRDLSEIRLNGVHFPVQFAAVDAPGQSQRSFGAQFLDTRVPSLSAGAVKQALLKMNTAALVQGRTKFYILTTLLALTCGGPGAIAQVKEPVQPTLQRVPSLVATASLQTTAATSTPVSSAAEKGALVRFIMAEYRTTGALASRIVNAAYSAGARYGLSPSLVLAIISRESTFNPRATSGYGAQGLMQVVPRFHMDKLPDARAATARASLFHPETNIDVGTRILAEYIEQASGVRDALVKYSGRAPRYAEKVLQAHATFERVRQEAGEDFNGTA